MAKANEHSNEIQAPKLVMVRGLPGSGKSYLSLALAKRLGDSRVLVLDPDTIDTNNEDYVNFSKELSSQGLDEAIHPFRWLRRQACDGVQNRKIVIWNQPFTIRGIFDRLVDYISSHAQEHGVELDVLVVEVEISTDTAKKRVVDRKNEGGHGPSENTFLRRLSEYGSFADGYKTVVVEGTNEIEDSVSLIINELELS